MTHLSTAERIGRREGRKEGLTEGRMEEAQASILEILEVRIGTVPSDFASRLARVQDLGRLHNLRKLLINGASLSEIERALNSANPT